MVNSEGLTGTTEFLTLSTKCRTNRCRYNRVLPYNRNGAKNITFCYINLILFVQLEESWSNQRTGKRDAQGHECNTRVLFTKQGRQIKAPNTYRRNRCSWFLAVHPGKCRNVQLP